jgi:peptide deformylase
MLPIVTLPDERLFRDSKPVEVIDGSTEKFVLEMLETMHEADGLGLAAVQVGVHSRIFVIQLPEDDPLVFINPRILLRSDRTGAYEEGCLSVPGVYSDVIRPLEVKVSAWDAKGKEFTLEADELLARVIQHEYDHLDGTLFFRHLKKRQQERFLRVYQKTHPEADLSAVQALEPQE